MTEYLSVTEYGKLHGLDGGFVRKLIAQARIPAVKIGNQWAIPADTPKPEDKRVKSGEYRGWRKKNKQEQE